MTAFSFIATFFFDLSVLFFLFAALLHGHGLVRRRLRTPARNLEWIFFSGMVTQALFAIPPLLAGMPGAAVFCAFLGLVLMAGFGGCMLKRRWAHR